MPPERILRVGIDVGQRSLVLRTARDLDDVLTPRIRAIPMCMAYAPQSDGGGRRVLVGADALARRHEVEIIHPLSAGDPRALFDFAKALRRVIDPGFVEEVRGVVACPSGASGAALRALRLLANEVCDRTQFVDSAFLMATGFGSQRFASDAVWVDVGATAVRLAAIRSGVLEPGSTLVVCGGTDAAGKRLQVEFLRRFPSTPLTRRTVDSIQMRFAHVRPLRVPSVLKVRTPTGERGADISGAVARACEPLVGDILEGLRRLLGSAPGGRSAPRDLVLVGGGAHTRGLGDRVASVLSDELGCSVRARVPDDPSTVVASGALRWAFRFKERDWVVPIFSLAS